MEAIKCASGQGKATDSERWQAARWFGKQLYAAENAPVGSFLWAYPVLGFDAEKTRS